MPSSKLFGHTFNKSLRNHELRMRSYMQVWYTTDMYNGGQSRIGLVSWKRSGRKQKLVGAKASHLLKGKMLGGR